MTLQKQYMAFNIELTVWHWNNVDKDRYYQYDQFQLGRRAKKALNF